MPIANFLQIHQDDHEATRSELAAGLLAPEAHVAPKFFYDALGARLFEAITELPEYYPTRSEAAIFARHAQTMARHTPRGAALIDLGAGNCAKAARLFDALAPARYVAVDISVDFLRENLGRLAAEHPHIAMTGLGLDFANGLRWPAGAPLDPAQPRLLFYPGSSIGNFTPAQALAFLQSLHGLCAGVAGSGVLIGVDLVKDSALLQAAYDDALGVTAAFNLNVLRNANRVLGSDFVLSDWAHVGVFNADLSRIEMYVQARRAATVRWPAGERLFAAGERIHTENSYKWTVDGFADLLALAGFGAQTGAVRHWANDEWPFAVFWAGL